MNKLIALTALVACFTSASALAQSTTSTATIKTSAKSFKQRLGFSYFGQLDKVALSENTVDGKNSSFFNQFTASYELDSTSFLYIIPRFQIVDGADENGKGDRFDELDTRLRYSTQIFKLGNHTFETYLTAELPTSKGSMAAKKIIRTRAAIFDAARLDDYNTLLVWLEWSKDYYQESQGPTDTISRYSIGSWISYRNSKIFSEKYVLRFDYSSSLAHMEGGYSDNYLMNGSETISAGVNLRIAAASVFPYISHQPAGTKAVDTLGGGVQIIKNF